MANMVPSGCAGIETHVTHALVMASMDCDGRTGTETHVSHDLPLPEIETRPFATWGYKTVCASAVIAPMDEPITA